MDLGRSWFEHFCFDDYVERPEKEWLRSWLLPRWLWLRYKARYSPEPLSMIVSHNYGSHQCYSYWLDKDVRRHLLGYAFLSLLLRSSEFSQQLLRSSFCDCNSVSLHLKPYNACFYSLDSLFGVSIVQGYLYFIDNDDQWPLRLFVIIKLISGFGLSSLII